MRPSLSPRNRGSVCVRVCVLYECVYFLKKPPCSNIVIPRRLYTTHSHLRVAAAVVRRIGNVSAVHPDSSWRPCVPLSRGVCPFGADFSPAGKLSFSPESRCLRVRRLNNEAATAKQRPLNGRNAPQLRSTDGRRPKSRSNKVTR